MSVETVVQNFLTVLSLELQNITRHKSILNKGLFSLDSKYKVQSMHYQPYPLY